jgi:hypothetical protein
MHIRDHVCIFLLYHRIKGWLFILDLCDVILNVCEQSNGLNNSIKRYKTISHFGLIDICLM